MTKKKKLKKQIRKKHTEKKSPDKFRIQKQFIDNLKNIIPPHLS